MATKFTIGPGWGLIASDDQGGMDYCGEPVLGCVVVPPMSEENDWRSVRAIPLSDDPVIRNGTIEVVEPGTTCD